MAHVPLDDETLDVAIFSLSLMGTNFADYLREACRTLKLDGQLHVIEPTSRFTDREGFMEGLKAFGFDAVKAEDLWKFTHIRALKTERRPREGSTATVLIEPRPPDRDPHVLAGGRMSQARPQLASAKLR